MRREHFTAATTMYREVGISFRLERQRRCWGRFMGTHPELGRANVDSQRHWLKSRAGHFLH